MRRRRTARVRAVIGVATAALLIVVGLPVAHGGFTAGVSDSSDSYGDGAVVLSATANSSTCATSASTISTNANANCSSTLFPPALSGGTASSSSTFTNAGNLSAGTVRLAGGSSCGVLDAADDSTAVSNAAVLTGGVQSTTAAPFPGSTSLAFDGSTGYLQTQRSYDNPQTYSLAAWFETPSGSSGGGSIIGYDTLQSDSVPYHWDRMLWVDSAGNLAFGAYDNGLDVITSPSTYNNGAWHFVVVTESSSGTDMYVDGSLVASNSSYTTSEHDSGWWHIGWANESEGWPDTPDQAFFSGDLADIAVFPTALSGSSVSTLYSAASQSAEQTDVLADSPSSYWPLTTTSASSTGSMEQFGTTEPDLSGASNTATVENGVFASGSSPFSGGSANAFDGATGFLETANALNDPQNFSIGAWFKIAAGNVGTVIGFMGGQSTTQSGGYDRQIWIDNSGKVVWSVTTSSGSPTEIASSSSYADGGWHFVVASVSSAGIALYVDGSLVASNSSATTAQNYTGYWHLGWGGENFGGWSDPPSSSYFGGDLSNIAIFPTALTSGQVTTLYGETSQSAEQSAILADSPTSYWPLVTAQTVSYCQEVDATIENDTVTGSPACLLPSGGGSCPALSSSTLLSSLTGSALTLPTISSGSSDTIKISLDDQSTAYEGMHFALPLTLSAASGGFTASLEYPGTTASQTFKG